ncbi:selenocysteine-specific translation elongation factor [Micromonospora sp. WMMD718]|uniref:Selenocysteine-specific translation elongation factor n=1 Tax=Micromonospora aurantiaca (nom. illeg.) TaxID=47850 RepID=A0ABQ6UGA2_9ACTN|nr:MULTISPECIES: selenocysteine-specific translation elongation factor [Micromonospora]KAB1111918.1 selenocysteine-specific translation elongation factor [Micromonospora aurantiaca]MDG4751752.1 selenocysteine-specific translation elongation factor [Micromonospora sp. WMMD718]UFN91573.1 selenocysteine-specific translation elongation factor [Micromonospora aurantiaca]
MWVVATAGHVDHGKSTLVRALTGMVPDRWAEERRRGMTIDLGFAWTTLPSGGTLAFVDVPGHERFVPNMLAGIGPVPAALIVVAADEGWMPQSAEHLAALHALGVSYGLLAVTRADLADPGPAAARARTEIAATSLGEVEAVPVSGVTGAGLPELRAALDRLGARLPDPARDAPVRLWVDRAFTVRGSGTVVTGTLGGGRLRVGDELELAATGEAVRVRGLHSLGTARTEVEAVARVAVNLRGLSRDRVGRGDALLTPGRFGRTDLLDVRLSGDPAADLPATLTLHVGSAAVPAQVRPLGPDTVRLRLARPLPLLIGDRALLRDPGRHHVAGGVTVLDVDPPPLRRRGAAAARTAVLAGLDGRPDLAGELRRRRLVRAGDLTRMGVPPTATPVAGQWLADPEHWRDLGRRLTEEVARYAAEHPLAAGVPVDVLRHRLDLPERALVTALLRPPLRLRDGLVTAAPQGTLPDPVARAVDRVRAEYGDRPFQAPEAHHLADLGLGPREIGAAVRAGALLKLAENVVLLPGAPDDAVRVLAGLPQPFTLSAARQALGTTRRVAVPLLELLDRRGATRRLPDDAREVVRPPG